MSLVLFLHVQLDYILQVLNVGAFTGWLKRSRKRVFLAYKAVQCAATLKRAKFVRMVTFYLEKIPPAYHVNS
jgi:hypothetical protein